MTVADRLEERLGDLAVALATTLAEAGPAQEAALGEALVPLLASWIDFLRSAPEGPRPGGDLAAAARAFAARASTLGVGGERLAEGFRALRDLAWERALDLLPPDAANFLRFATRLDEALELMVRVSAGAAAEPGEGEPQPRPLLDPMAAERHRLEEEIADLRRVHGALVDEARAQHRALIAAIEHEVEWWRRQRELAEQVADLERRLARIRAMVGEARALLERLASLGGAEGTTAPGETW